MRGGDEAEAYGSIISPRNRAGVDMVIFNSSLNTKTLTQNAIIVHEFGHNATNRSHGDTYHYSQNGLQSNEENRMGPSRKNKIDVITSSPVYEIYDKLAKPDNRS